MAHGQYKQYNDGHTDSDENVSLTIQFPKLLIQLHCISFRVAATSYWHMQLV